MNERMNKCQAIRQFSFILFLFKIEKERSVHFFFDQSYNIEYRERTIEFIIKLILVSALYLNYRMMSKYQLLKKEQGGTTGQLTYNCFFKSQNLIRLHLQMLISYSKCDLENVGTYPGKSGSKNHTCY